MIDENVLRELLADAAATVPAPGRAPGALADALAASDASPRRRRRRGTLAGAAAVVIVVLGATVVMLGGNDGGGRDRDLAGIPDRSDNAGSVASSVEATSGASAGAAIAPAAPPGGAGQIAPGAAVDPAQADTARVIKTGSLDLEVREGAFGPTIERVASLAVGAGGYVAESNTTESGDVPHGSVTLRIPAGSFDQSVTELRQLGEVKGVTSKGTDVTAQFTDLAARLSALSATRDRLFEVLRGARNVGDIIALQDRITGVQTEIEQIQGRERLLADQTSFATLAVTVAEPGGDTVTDAGLGAAWEEAKRRFGDTIEGLVEWSGTAAVVAIVGLLIAGLGWFAWPRARRRLV